MNLVFFCDRDGSMVPFHLPCDRFLATVDPKRFPRVEQYYFRNVPHRFVYLRPKGAQIRELSELFPSLSPSRTVAVIVSDAGAARGNYNPPRVELIRQFLNEIQPYVRPLVWLNPMPPERWQGTAAAVQDVLGTVGGGMFPLSQQGFRDALEVVRG